MAKAWKRLADDKSGQIAVIFALSSTAIVVALGSSIDLSRAYTARQKLSQAAELTCQYSQRPSVIAVANLSYSFTYGATGGISTYLSAVNAYASNALAAQHWSGTMPTAPSGTYFTATAATGTSTSATGTAPTNPTVELSASVPTYFLGIVNIHQVKIHAKIACLSAASAPSIVTSTDAKSTTNYVLEEGFENTCGPLCYINPYGGTTGLSTPTQTNQSTPMYTGNYGSKWYIIGYCLEIDQVGRITSTTPEGSHEAELDCDNGSNTGGNSSISAQVYLAAGNYELRYQTKSRVTYPNYTPAYICGTTAADVSWANDKVITGGPSQDDGSAYRTNQINVYLDMVTSSSVPLHTTLDGKQKLGGSNLIDVCVYAPAWTQRSVKITVLTPAYYWLSFAADGKNDSFGGELDQIQLCQETCSGTPTDNFPTAWVATNGVTLFEDKFESPTYSVNSSGDYVNTTGNINLSSGTSGTASSGWPAQSSYGWGAAPYNQVSYVGKGATQGTQYIALDVASGTSPTNRSISRQFYLDPGYYQVSYEYMSMVEMATSGYTYCYSAPASGVISGLQPNQTGTVLYGATGTYNGDTDILGVFMSHGLSISTPSASVTEGSATPFTNANGTTATYPTLPNLAPDSVDYQAYTATQVNPLIDECSYAPAYTWVPRTVNVEITKPGPYWLTFSATAGTGDSSHPGDGAGPAIDDVKLTALGSPYMSNPPTSALTVIPTPAPAHDTAYYGPSSNFNGFYIIADPFEPPAADR
jgi:hypothetical protein